MKYSAGPKVLRFFLQRYQPPIDYYRDSEHKEIDLIIEQNNTLYPIEIKKSSNPKGDAVKHFNVLEKTGKKIRDAEVKKVPYMLIVGEKEEIENTVSIRKHGEGDKRTFTIEEFSLMLQQEIKNLLEK